jgi:signal transduction histidine kinase
MKFDTVFLLDSAAWPAFLVESSGTIRRANQAAIQCFGPRLEGESCSLAALWCEENGGTAEQFLAQWDRAPAPLVPLQLRGKGAAPTAFTAHICAFRGEGEKRFLFQLLPPAGTDSKGQSVEANLAQKQKLDCALQLTRTVALDFNNALTSILGHASLVLAKMAPDHPWRASLVEVEKAAEKAAEIAHQLAAFSRLEKESHGLAPGNLNVILRRLVDMFQQTQRPGITWSVQWEQRLYAAKFDEARVQQAFVKVLENALEAVGDTGRIGVTTRNLEITEGTQDRAARLEPGQYVCVEITDDGEGIPADVLPRVFEPFFTTKKGHRGLGLAWVYGIITNHGGGVAVSSEPQRGTSVRVYLPATKKFVRESALPDDDLSGTATILLVDDEDLLLTMGHAILTAYGYQVLVANSGPKALEMMIMSKARAPVDLVITDLVMPQMSGRELIEQIRQLSPGTPIICTSGFVRPGGNDDAETYLQKPFTSQELLRRVKRVLAARADAV